MSKTTQAQGLAARKKAHGQARAAAAAEAYLYTPGFLEYRGARFRILFFLVLFCLGVFAALFFEGHIDDNMISLYLGGVGCIGTAIAGVVLLQYPDVLRTRVTQSLLRTVSFMADGLERGFDEEKSKEICHLLLSETEAIAVALTDTEKIIVHVGAYASLVPAGTPIRTSATRAVLESGDLTTFSHQVDYYPKPLTYVDSEVDERFPFYSMASIVVPLKVRDETVGTLKFYYRNHKTITRNQYALTAGFGELLSNLLATVTLEEQAQLAMKAELKALQAQINPHFLFNTLNTIAAFTRTDPATARDLLRDFATFYRTTLDSSESLISLSQEIEQTERYLRFELARFGKDRIVETVQMDEALKDLKVPAFIVQPLVENAVRHARKEDEALHIDVVCGISGKDVILSVSDDGVGMDEETVQYLLESIHAKQIVVKNEAPSAGIALYNVQKRLEANFGAPSGIEISSIPNYGSTVTLRLANAAKQRNGAQEET